MTDANPGEDESQPSENSVPHEPRPTSLLEAALEVAASGCLVFPLRTEGPEPKAPRTTQGYKDATADPDQIMDWWTRWPNAAIATPTGAPYFTVLDVDVRPDGDGGEALDTLRRAGLLRGCGRVVRTPSGGLHLYFEGDEEPSHGVQEHHLDLKSVGGYVAGPPSRILVSNAWGSYQEVERGPCGPLDWQACREVLSALPTTGRRSTSGLVKVVLQAPLGGRNNALFWAASRAAESGLATDQLLEAALSTGLDADEATRTIASATRAARVARADGGSAA